jgi:hypothetical protein
LPSKKDKKIATLIGRVRGEFAEPLKEALIDGVVSKKDFERLFGLLSDTFDELLNDSPNDKRMERKIRELILGISDLNYDSEVTDETLRQAVKLIREKIVGRSQKESLARLIAEEMVESWTKADSGCIERIAGDGGLIEQMQNKIDGGIDFGDDELIALMTSIGGEIAVRYLEKLSEDEADDLLERSLAIARAIEKKEKLGDNLLETAKLACQKLGAISLMRRAFTGLLLGDIILRQVGKSLGITGGTTVTDFIIFVGAKVFESEGIKKADAAQTRRFIEALEEVKNIPDFP